MVRPHDREILRLAVPAFLALVAEPLFLLADAAVVGRLGTPQLAGLGIAAVILQTAIGLCVFLAYGTTASVARRLGAGDLRGALAQGVDGVWLAVGIGAVVTVAGVALTGPLVAAFGVGPEVAGHATTYLRIAFLGTVPLLVMLASTGVLRGLQDTRTPLVVAVAGNGLNIVLNVVLVFGVGSWPGLGIAGSAIGSVLAQLASAAALLAVVVRAARREQASLRPDLPGIRMAARAAVALVIRTLTLRAALLVTTYAVTLGATTGREQELDLATHQLAMTLWTFLAFVLDAIAIAAQAITGRSLGAGDVAATRAATRRMVQWGVVSGLVTGLLLAAAEPVARPAVQPRRRPARAARPGAPRRCARTAGGRHRLRPRRGADRRRRRSLPGRRRAGHAGRLRAARARARVRRRRPGHHLGGLHRRLHGRPARGPRPPGPRHRLAGDRCHRRSPVPHPRRLVGWRP